MVPTYWRSTNTDAPGTSLSSTSVASVGAADSDGAGAGSAFFGAGAFFTGAGAGSGGASAFGSALATGLGAGAVATGASGSGAAGSRMAKKRTAPSTSRAARPARTLFTPGMVTRLWGPGPAITHNPSVTILCLASYNKGHDFMREAHRLGCRVLLVTSESLRDAAWPRECITEMFYVPDVQKQWKLEDLLLGVSHLARREVIDRIVPLDDFDLEKASALREHLRVPGMGETTTRYFRDKLAMRVKAASDGIPVPGFVHVLNEARIRAFCAEVDAAVVPQAAPAGRGYRHPEDQQRRGAVGRDRRAGGPFVPPSARNLRRRRRLSRRLHRL